MLGFEQANKYTVFNQDGQVVALLAEDDSFVRTITRQLFRTRRPFTATVLSPDGTEILFRIQRPFYLLASHARIVSADGETVLGEIFGRWHLWRRNYDLYIDRRQFAAIRGGLWAWDFELTDAQGKPLALIDRNFQVWGGCCAWYMWYTQTHTTTAYTHTNTCPPPQGLAKELFTDAGKYAIHFGSPRHSSAEQAAATIRAAHPTATIDSSSLTRNVPDNALLVPTATGSQLVVARPLGLSERMAVLAAAISIDYDYFSRHSHGGGVLGMGGPVVPLPMPVPGGGGENVGEDAAGAGGGAVGAGEGMGGGQSNSNYGGESATGVDANTDGFTPDSFDDELLDDGGDDGDGEGGWGGIAQALTDFLNGD